MKRYNYFFWVLIVTMSFVAWNAALAETRQEGMTHEHVMKFPTKELLVDGVIVKFWVETMMEHHEMMQEMGVPMEGMKMDMDSTHEITMALSDEKGNKPITDAKINLKIIRPDGTDQTKMAMWMEGMDHFGADFRMNQPGKYQILTLFKEGGKKHKAGFYYDMEASSAGSQHTSAQEQPLYACPMPSDDYFSHAPGECPNCGMGLVELDEEQEKKLYTCPMAEDDHFSHKPGKCPKCGMKLMPNK